MEKEKSQFVTLNINQSKQTTTLDSNDNDSSEKIDDIGSEKVRPLLRYDEKNKCRYDSLPSKKLTSKKIRFADRNHKLNPYSDEISKQNSKIEQIQKALRLCSLNRHLMKCSERIVAEKMLLVETIKKGLLQQASLNSPLSLPKNSNIVIRNIRFDLKTNEADNCTHYYICLIKNGIDVVTSEIAIPIKNVIIFKKTMDIKDVHPNLVLSLYFMKVPNGERTGKNRYTSYIKKVLKKILFILSTQKTCELKQRQYSEFECVGSATLSSLTSQDPTLDVPVNSCVVEQFVAEVEVSDK
ncbi:uncharacterized protein LOC126265630 [Aethina tumida]|uniref:uncharacterized protein LOC126265630 n=1 Tax=Aethina tumida TaxID=116153 RepID=UPI002147F453|nr:uncharacterized protein LOC126265630 [Aethina tumida]